MWQNQKFLCIGLGPISISACRGSSKQIVNLKGDGAAFFPRFCVNKEGLLMLVSIVCWLQEVKAIKQTEAEQLAKKNLSLTQEQM